jgi:methylated-DNA-[protein]-cysteine S-methyltransferase
MKKQKDQTLATMSLATPVGELRLAASEAGLTAVAFPCEAPTFADGRGSPAARAHLGAAARALREYFAGRRRDFDDLTLAPEGTEFQMRVWKALSAIPFGTTKSYAQIARVIGNPKAMRAVGLANGRNPIAIIVPCHRVIGADGRMVGFSANGGVITKMRMLEIEGWRANEPSLFDEMA